MIDKGGYTCASCKRWTPFGSDGCSCKGMVVEYWQVCSSCNQVYTIREKVNFADHWDRIQKSTGTKKGYCSACSNSFDCGE